MNTNRCWNASARRPEPVRRALAGVALAGALLLPHPLVAAAQTPMPEAPQAPECPEFKQLCVAARQGGEIDLETGIAVMTGDVRGHLRTEQIVFRSDVLRAFRNDGGEWTRLVLERDVRVAHEDTLAVADHGILEAGQTLLFGNVRVHDPLARVTADEVLVQRRLQRTTLRGTPAQPVHARVAEVAASGGPPGEGTAEPAAGRDPFEPRTVAQAPMEIRAQTIVVHHEARRMEMAGNVDVQRPAVGWHLTARSARLELTADNRLQRFRAEGDVVLRQPGRTARANVAESKDDGEVIVLLGDARVEQEEQFSLASQRIELYTEVSRGVVQSDDRDRPLTLSLDLAPPHPYELRPDGLERLRTHRVPAATVDKLAPLVGQQYTQRADLVQALHEVLSPDEAERYEDLIVAEAR